MTARPEPRPRPQRSLSVRLFVLVVSVTLLVEGLIFLPGLQRERARWLAERLRDAQIVALAAGSQPGHTPDQGAAGDQGAGGVPMANEMDLRRVSGAEMIRVLDADGAARVIFAPPRRTSPTAMVDLTTESWLQGFSHALGGLVEPRREVLEITGNSLLGTRLDVLVDQAPLRRFLRIYALRFAAIALMIAAATGGLLFVALRAMLVLPLRRMARNIMLFRTDPERGVPLDAERVSVVHDDEITMVGRELSAMQGELRTALWRNARLAAVGTAVAKMSHDLRGTLSPAMLVADRLTMHAEERVCNAGEVIVRAVNRATALAQHTLDFVREGPPALTRRRVNLHALIAEAAGMVEASLAATDPDRTLHMDNAVADGAEVDVDHDCMLRVLTNLLRNAAQAGARSVFLSATGQGAATVVMLRDDGPGLPDAVHERLFQPFVSNYRSGGTGLGLAIARDLMRAHGGDLMLAGTGPGGTSFTLHLQQPRREEE